MIQAIVYGAVSGAALLIGAFIGLSFKLRQKMIAAFMAFGSGVLICAITFGLMEEAFRHGGFDAVIIGFLLGGVAFIVSDYFVHASGGRKHKRKQLFVPKDDDKNANAIVVGTVLDGIPESIALGVALYAGGGTGILMLAAIFLSNFPEAISSIAGLRREGFSKKKIYWLWSLVAIMTILIVSLSYNFLGDIRANNLGILEAFAGGALLAMLADTMMPEAYDEGGFEIGFLTVVGFLVAFIISRFK